MEVKCLGQVLCNWCLHKETPTCPGGRPIHEVEQISDQGLLLQAEAAALVYTARYVSNALASGNQDYLRRDGD